MTALAPVAVHADAYPTDQHRTPAVLPDVSPARQRRSDDWICEDCDTWLRFFEHDELEDPEDWMVLVCTSCGLLFRPEGIDERDGRVVLHADRSDLKIALRVRNARSEALFGYTVRLMGEHCPRKLVAR